MKKLLGWMIVMMMMFSACVGKVGPPGRDGLDGEVTYWKIIDFAVKSDDWLLKGDGDEIGSFYYYLFDNVHELSQDIYDNGLIVCYYRYRDEFGDNVQTVLPFTYYDIFVDQQGNEFPYSVQYTYDTTPGSIAFKVVFSDFYTLENKPPACSFRLHLIY